MYYELRKKYNFFTLIFTITHAYGTQRIAWKGGSGSEKAPYESQSALDRLNEKEAQYMFVSADADCKGRLTREDFIQAMMKRGLDREVKLSD